MVLVKLSTNIYSSRLTSRQAASVVAETELQPPEGSDFKFSAWSFRESTGKQMLFIGGTCHLRRVVPSGGWALQASSQRKGAGLQEEGARKCVKRNEGTCSHLPLRYS